MNIRYFQAQKMVMRYLLVTAFLLGVVYAGSRAPQPSCNTPPIQLQDLPISLDETQYFNLDNIFTGYNIHYEIPNMPESVGLRKKLFKVNETNLPQPGLRSYHLAHPGNQWGTTIVTLSVENGTTIVRYGSSSDNSSLPTPSEKVQITHDGRVECFDSVWFRAQRLLMIDCVNNTGLTLQNIFMYVNTSTHEVKGPVKNDLFVPFSAIHHRKIRLMEMDGDSYLIRGHFAEKVDERNNHNTYLQVLKVDNPMKPWTLKVIDRSFLHQPKLSIMDFQIYLGDIFILDFHSGVTRLTLWPSQHVVIDARYRTDSGFTRMGLYSGNLDHKFLLVLAHGHSIFEIDWSDTISPKIISKYSIPDGSTIHSLWCNEQYVAVQISANLTDSLNNTKPYQSSLVLTRGSRSYMNAYVALPHHTDHAFVDLNRQNSYLMTMDTEKIEVHALSSPRVAVLPTNRDLLNKQFSFTVEGYSKNEYDPDIKHLCTFQFKFIVVPNDSLLIWPTGRHLPDVFYSNYPGQLFIDLDRFVLGANITYFIQIGKGKDGLEPPTHFILQQNSTSISWWDKKPSLFKYTFLRQEQFDSRDETQIYIYSQDYDNSTHFSRCITVPFTEEVHCVESGHAPHINFKIDNLTATRFHYYGGQYLHLAAILYEQFPNQVFIYDVESGAELGARPIIFPEGYEGKVQAVEFVGHYLAVVLRYVKEIVFFDMKQCFDHQEKECEQVYRIDSIMTDKLGVEYFAPMDIYTSDFHPWVLFIQCLDRVVILDIGRNGPVLLQQIKSPATKEHGFYKWKMAIAKGELLIVNPPNIIEEFNLDELYTYKNTAPTKFFPTFKYQIPDKFDLDFSDSGNLVYITAIDPDMSNQTNTVILVYRTGYPAVSSFYDVFHLNLRYDDVLIDATGSFGDYIAVAHGSILSMFRQYQDPIVVIEDAFDDYKFNVTYTNQPQHSYKYFASVQVKVANFPEDIIINDSRLNQNDFLSGQISYNKSFQRYDFNDLDWFNGSVLNYTLEGCSECNSKVKVVNHVNEERVVLGIHDMEDYAFSEYGGMIQQFQSIIKMHHNGSIHQFAQLPSVLDGETCTIIEYSFLYDFSLSACKEGDEVYLYQTVYSASKPFVLGPYYSSAKHVTSMRLHQDLMIIVDVDEREWYQDREGGVIIYSMNHDFLEPDLFDELEYIDSSDLQGAHNWPGGQAYIGNAYFGFTNQTDSYRLVMSELNSGFFVMDFKWQKGRKSVEILRLEFINLKEELARLHMPMPNGAHFTAISVTNEYYDSVWGYWQMDVVIVTSNFHSFEVNLHIDKTGIVLTHQVTKVYYRYGFYQSNNYIKSFDGYFAIPQRLPTLFEPFEWYSPNILTVYDTRERWQFGQEEQQHAKANQYFANTNIPVSYIMGGFGFHQKKGNVRFDWNVTLTRDRVHPFNGLSLLAVHTKSAKIREFSVHQKLHIILQEGIKHSQHARLKAQNDYHSLEIPLNVIVPGDDEGTVPGWGIALIVIGSVAVAAIAGYVIYVKVIRKGAKPFRESETEKSLLEREGEFEGKDDSSSGEEESSGEQGSQEQEEEEEQQKPEEPRAETTEPAAEPVVDKEPSAEEGEGGEQAQAESAQAAEEEGQKPEQ